MNTTNWITTSTILQRLHDFGDAATWDHFVRRFRKPIVLYATKRGLSNADAEEVAQETLTAFVESYRLGGYQRHLGRLSDWIFGIAWRRVLKSMQKKVVVPAELDQLEASERAQMSEHWQESWISSVLAECVLVLRGEFQENTYRAFERTVLGNCSAEEVASELGMTRNAVFIAKHRVSTRMRELLSEMGENL